MTHLAHTSCCGLKDFAEIRQAFVSPRDIAAPLQPALSEGIEKLISTLKDAVCVPLLEACKLSNGVTVNIQVSLRYNPRCSHILFTDHHATRWGRPSRTFNVPYGKILAKYILKHKLGHLVCSRRRSNPNSGNLVTCWIWTIDDERLEAHFLEKFPVPSKKEQIEKWEAQIKVAMETLPIVKPPAAEPEIPTVVPVLPQMTPTLPPIPLSNPPRPVRTLTATEVQARRDAGIHPNSAMGASQPMDNNAARRRQRRSHVQW